MEQTNCEKSREESDGANFPRALASDKKAAVQQFLNVSEHLMNFKLKHPLLSARAQHVALVLVAGKSGFRVSRCHISNPSVSPSSSHQHPQPLLPRPNFGAAPNSPSAPLAGWSAESASVAGFYLITTHLLSQQRLFPFSAVSRDFRTRRSLQMEIDLLHFSFSLDCKAPDNFSWCALRVNLGNRRDKSLPNHSTRAVRQRQTG